MFETRQQKLLSPHRFVRRQLASLLLGLVTLGVALSIGVAGYHWIGGLAWVDALLDASMILSGMGPVEMDLTNAGRVFESLYALFCGVILLGSAGILFTPVIHRLLHRFHLEDSGQ